MKPIFRSIEVDHGQHLTLGSPIPPDVLPLMRPAGPGRWQMRSGTFGGAESITAVVAADANVQRMEFGYAPGTVYQTLLEDFESELGPPTTDGAGQRSVWEDAETRFELFQLPGQPGPQVGSELVDRAG